MIYLPEEDQPDTPERWISSEVSEPILLAEVGPLYLSVYLHVAVVTIPKNSQQAAIMRRWLKSKQINY